MALKAHIAKQLKLAEKFLNNGEVEECFRVCRQVEGLIESADDNAVILTLKNKHSNIIRNLNMLMVNKIKKEITTKNK